MSPVLLDTGPIVAILDESDEHHHVCRIQLQELHLPLLTCWPVIVEAAWLLRQRPDTVAELLIGFERGGFRLLPLDEQDLPPISAILTKYSNLRLQLADAALLHLANRERIPTIFTLDRRDFELVRLKNGKRPRLIP